MKTFVKELTTLIVETLCPSVYNKKVNCLKVPSLSLDGILTRGLIRVGDQQEKNYYVGLYLTKTKTLVSDL